MMALGMAFLLAGYAFVYNALARWTSTDGNFPSLSENLGLTAGSITLGKKLGGSGSPPPTGGNQTGQPPSTVPAPPGGTMFNPFPSGTGPLV